MKRKELLHATAAFGLIAATPSTASAAPPAPLEPPVSGGIPVAFLLSDGAVIIDFCGPWDVFRDVQAGGRHGDGFRLYTVAETTRPIRASGGMKIVRCAGRRRARTSPCRSAPALSCSRAPVCSQGGRPPRTTMRSVTAIRLGVGDVPRSSAMNGLLPLAARILISAIFVQGALGKINACRRRENRRLREDLIPSERHSLRFRCWKETSCELAGYRTSCRCSAYESRHTTWRRSRSRIRHRSGEPHDIRRRASILRRDTRLADSLHGNVPSHNRSDTGLDTSRSDVAPRLRSKDRRPSPTARALRATTNPSPHNRRIDMGNRPHTCLHRHIAGHRASKPSHIGSYKPIGRSVAVEATRVPAPLCRPRRRLAGRLPDRRPTPAHARAGLQEAPAAACRALRPKGAPPRRPAHQAGAAADPRTAQTRSRGTATARGSGRGASA